MEPHTVQVYLILGISRTNLRSREKSPASPCFKEINCSLIKRIFFLHVFVAWGAVFTNNFIQTAFLNLCPASRARRFLSSRTGDLTWSVRSLRRKLEFQRLSTYKIQVASFNFGERLTRETVFSEVRSCPFISMSRLPSGCQT